MRGLPRPPRAGLDENNVRRNGRLMFVLGVGQDAPGLPHDQAGKLAWVELCFIHQRDLQGNGKQSFVSADGWIRSQFNKHLCRTAGFVRFVLIVSLPSVKSIAFSTKLSCPSPPYDCVNCSVYSRERPLTNSDKFFKVWGGLVGSRKTALNQKSDPLGGCR